MDSVAPPCKKLNFDISGPDIGGNTLHYRFFQYPDSSISYLRGIFTRSPAPTKLNNAHGNHENSDTPINNGNISKHTQNVNSLPTNTASNSKETHYTLDNISTNDSLNNDFISTPDYTRLTEPLSSMEDIIDLFDVDNYNPYRGMNNVSYLDYSSDSLRAQIDSKLEFIYEALNANGSNMTLTKLEGFLRILTTESNPIGTLTPYGSLMAHTCLQFLKTFIKSHKYGKYHDYNRENATESKKSKSNKTAPPQEPETTNGVSSDFSKIAMYNFELYSKQLMDTINAQEEVIEVNPKRKSTEISDTSSADANSTDLSENNDKRAISPQMLKIIKTGSDYLQNLVSKFSVGFEPHFPRMVCGKIDRSLVTDQASLIVPIEKSGRNIYIALEALSDTYGSSVWPELNELPKNITVGTKIQLAWHKSPANMRWYIGKIMQFTGSQYTIQVSVETNEFKSKYCLLKHFVPPNLPVVRPEKAWWRLVPREINLNTDIYVGSCLSLYDITSSHESIDCVICNVYYDVGSSPNAPIKGPNEEIYKNDKSPLELRNRLNCSCQGPSNRVRQGVLTTGVTRVHVYCMSQKLERIIPIKSLRGYKLNYDLHAHLDSGSDLGPQQQSTAWAWVIPRLVLTRDNKCGGEKYWSSNPRYSLVILPFHKNMEYVITATDLMAILHPDLGISSLYSNNDGTGRHHGSIPLRNSTSQLPTGLTFAKTPLLDRLFGCNRIRFFHNRTIDMTTTKISGDIPATRCSKCCGYYYANKSHRSSVDEYHSSAADLDYRKKIQIAAAVRWKRARESPHNIFTCYDENDDLIFRTKNFFTLAWEHDARTAELAYRRAHVSSLQRQDMLNNKFDSKSQDTFGSESAPNGSCSEGLLEKFNESVRLTETAKFKEPKNAAKLLEAAILGGWISDGIKPENFSNSKGDSIFKYINRGIQAKAARDALEFLRNCSPPCLSKQIGKHYTPLNAKESMLSNRSNSPETQNTIPPLDIGTPMILPGPNKKLKMGIHTKIRQHDSIFDNHHIAPICEPGIKYDSLRSFLEMTSWDEDIESELPKKPSVAAKPKAAARPQSIVMEDIYGDESLSVTNIDPTMTIIWSDTE